MALVPAPARSLECAIYMGASREKSSILQHDEPNHRSNPESPLPCGHFLGSAPCPDGRRRREWRWAATCRPLQAPPNPNRTPAGVELPALTPPQKLYRALSPPPVRSDREQRWAALPGGSATLAVAASARSHPGLSVMVCADQATADLASSELRFLAGELEVFGLPDRETLPYEPFSPHQDLISERLATLHRLPRSGQGILVSAVHTLMHRLPPPQHFHHSFLVRRGERLDLESLARQLQQTGYQRVETVYQRGEFALRGSLVDVYPMGSSQALRIDLLDDEVEELHAFDPESQRQTEALTSFRLLPAHEFPLDDAGLETFTRRWRKAFPNETGHSVPHDLSQGLVPAGTEYYLSLFFEQLAVIFDYLPAGCLLFLDDQVAPAAESFWQQVQERYRECSRQRPLPEPEQLFLNPSRWFSSMRGHSRVRLSAQSGGRAIQFDAAEPPSWPHNTDRPLQGLQQLLDGDGKQRVLLCADSPGRLDSLHSLLESHGMEASRVPDWPTFLAGAMPLAITVQSLQRGFELPSEGLILMTEEELSGHLRGTHPRRRRSSIRSELEIRQLAELQLDAPVVHVEKGVGRYLGLESMDFQGNSSEFLVLGYADGDRLYIPVTELHQIHRYGGIAEQAPLDTLNSKQWRRRRQRAARNVLETARQLVQTQAERRLARRPGLNCPEEPFQDFAAAFPYPRTPDQEQAIADIRKDMASEQIMDRVVCGDTGFGKTEVALCAAFIALQNRRQVAVLAPTTLLAEQHFERFRDRFSGWPVKVAVLSRLHAASRGRLLEQLADGQVQLVVGTHALLDERIQFQHLGLVIIDEEHRFGVRHKERLKRLRAATDLLSLTATPIPRTLNMVLSGLRDVSLISTPPPRRLAVKTLVHAYDEGRIREAILRELMRGGQVFYLHDRVRGLEDASRWLQELVPQARVAIAHGQMTERKLREVMEQFYHNRVNMLVCTTIIESGLDIANANTLIVERADRLGLAQLHQLRGRVGRSHHQAYAYLLFPDEALLGEDARQRLLAVAQSRELGGGFLLAQHDLEIRGAGTLLGEEQSGHLDDLGYGLYSQMLEKAITAMKAGQPVDSESLETTVECELELQLAAQLPSGYVSDSEQRLVLYRRLATAPAAELGELQEELLDRFGPLPVAARNLLELTRLRHEANRLGIERLELGGAGGVVRFHPQTPVQSSTLVNMIQSSPQSYSLSGEHELGIQVSLEEPCTRLDFARELLHELAKDARRA